MSDISVQVEIPNRSLFKASEVCDLVKLQPYVLRSWEAEFPNLGVAKSAGTPRVYRRSDVEQVVRIKHLLLVEGLTLAGAGRPPAGGGRCRRQDRTRAADGRQAWLAFDFGFNRTEWRDTGIPAL